MNHLTKIGFPLAVFVTSALTTLLVMSIGPGEDHSPETRPVTTPIPYFRLVSSEAGLPQPASNLTLALSPDSGNSGAEYAPGTRSAGTDSYAGGRVATLAHILCSAPECGIWIQPPSLWYKGNLAYILAYSKLDEEQAMDVLDNYYNACWQAKVEHPSLDIEAVVAAFVRIARYESHWNEHARGAAGERGTLQTWPGHRKSMDRMGLDFTSEQDRCLFWAYRVAERLDRGESFWRAFSPWSVVNGAYPDKARQIKSNHKHFMDTTARLESELGE